jgi:hypothetical protein
MRRLLAACVLGAVASLVLPSEPSYDPWAWIVWGREIASLDLDTVRGPSWKPLPVAFTALFAPLSHIDEGLPPALWLVVARAGALLALAMAFRLARRLAGPARATGLAAGLIAATALALTPGWLRNMAHGNEAPLAVALMLWAVERHLDGERVQVAVLGFLACLLRPEVFPFLAAYGVWLWRSEPRCRRLLAGLALALPALWLVPEWIGSGNPLGAGAQARNEPDWSLSLHDHPWLAALGRAHDLGGLPLEFGALAAAVFGWRERHSVAGRATVALAATAVLWVLLVAAMTQGGFSGSPRYFLPAVVIGCVLAGVGAARAVAAVPRAELAVALTALLAVSAYPWAIEHAKGVSRQAADAQRLARLQQDLSATVRRVGGHEAVLAHGPPAVNAAFVTRLAWEARVPIDQVARARGDGLVFYSGARKAGRPFGAGERVRMWLGTGRWRILSPNPIQAPSVTKG